MKTTPLKAIHQHCFNCIYDPKAGNGKKHEQTEACTSYKCALYDLRPITSAEKSRRNDEKIKEMSSAQLDAYKKSKAVKAAAFKRNITKPVESIKGGK